MNTLSRPTACLIAALVVACSSSAFSQESDPAAPAGESTDSQTAPANSESEGPVRPKRGKAPSLERISGVTVEANPDGTMTRRTEVLGQPVPGLEDSPPQEKSDAELPADPSYTAPSRATLGSSNEDPQIVEHAAPTPESSSGAAQGNNYLLLAGAGACVVVGIVLWLAMRGPRKA